jgi:uncharacterized protein YggE
MKRKTMLIGILVVAAAVLAACGASPQGAESRTLSINGSGMVNLAPDMATINLGVMSEAADVQSATAESNRVIEKIKEVLVEFGVEESDIQTTNFSVYPYSEYGYELEQTAETRYRVDNNVTVTIRELDKLGEVLNETILAGANSIYGVQYGISDQEDAYNQALEAAVENAKERAEFLAEASGAELGEMVTISTYYGGGSPVPYAEAAFGIGGGSGMVPVSPGSLVIRVDVSVVFALQ